MRGKPVLTEGVAKDTEPRPMLPSPQPSWERRHLAGILPASCRHLAGILPASAGTDRREGKAISPERRLGDACCLEGGTPSIDARYYCSVRISTTIVRRPATADRTGPHRALVQCRAGQFKAHLKPHGARPLLKLHRKVCRSRHTPPAYRPQGWAAVQAWTGGLHVCEIAWAPGKPPGCRRYFSASLSLVVSLLLPVTEITFCTRSQGARLPVT